MGGIEQRLRKLRSPVWSLRAAQPDTQVDSERWIGFLELDEEVQRLGVVAQRVGWSEGLEGGVAGLPAVVDGLGHVDGSVAASQ